MNCTGFNQEELNLYLDGELPLSRQQSLFSHMTVCADCRSVMEAVLTFRRMSRQEYINVPPAADDRFFKRLAELKSAGDQRDRVLERAPLWHARRPISVRAGISAVAAVFLIGFLLPVVSPGAGPTVHFEAERVNLSDPVTWAPPEIKESYVHVFYPGLTIEADSLDVSSNQMAVE